MENANRLSKAATFALRLARGKPQERLGIGIAESRAAEYRRTHGGGRVWLVPNVRDAGLRVEVGAPAGKGCDHEDQQ